MLRLVPEGKGRRRPLNVLCIGAHCDDIDLGCGGTLLALTRRRRANVTWVTFSGSDERQKELRASARRFLRGAERSTVLAHQY
ncbi:MAG: PIG-L family deacetylase, partial [Steroidobacterales bacterium]